MLILAPREVTFGQDVWPGVALVAIDRHPARALEEFGDSGPYAMFVDVPAQRVRLRIVQEALGDEPGAPPRPGDQAILSLVSAPAGRPRSRRLSALAVILVVEHEISLKRGSVRTITLAAVSSTGAADPIIITPIES